MGGVLALPLIADCPRLAIYAPMFTRINYELVIHI